jgi:hypothetical protein
MRLVAVLRAAGVDLTGNATVGGPAVAEVKSVVDGLDGLPDPRALVAALRAAATAPAGGEG